MILDVSEMSLTELREKIEKLPPESALRRSLTRLVEQLEDPNGVISAFSSFVK